jgi:hypothetical protein
MTLSNPWFEGRAPGSDGIERAADYVEFWFRQHGLAPAFPAEDAGSGDWTAYRQYMELPGGRPRITRSEMTIDGRGLESGRDFTVLGNAGTAEVSAPLAFVGYAIESGPDGYSSFGDDDSLEGRIAVVFRYEPLDDEGRSRFSSRRFSRQSSRRDVRQGRSRRRSERPLRPRSRHPGGAGRSRGRRADPRRGRGRR